MGNNAEMPRYKCHKVVHALKISSVSDYPSSHITLHFEDEGFLPKDIFEHSNEFARFEIREGDDMGYYVVYKDGYVSWSPTDVFEAGYTRL